MRILFFLISLIISVYTGAQEKNYCVMFYNAENLFSPEDDSLVSMDDDFTPEGVRYWSWYRYRKKVAGICKIILGANGWFPPEIIGLSEIENKSILKDIIYHPLMINFQYEILHRDGPDHRGMDVAILYRPDILHCIDTNWIPICYPSKKLIPTREILSAEFVIKSDTLVCYMNHWTSKFGGAFESEEKRILESNIMGKHILKLLQSRPGLHIIAGGDMNDHSESKPIQNLVRNYSLTEVRPANKSTYKYQGKWESIDHVFIHGEMDKNKCSAVVYANPLMLEPDIKYTGDKPFRTYSGYKYNGGYSDHLPLLLKFSF